MKTIENANITHADLTDGGRGFLTDSIRVETRLYSQGFGGYALYLPEGYTNHQTMSAAAGHFIWRVMEIAGVTSWSEVVGRNIRICIEEGRITAIGHIVKNDWFYPAEDFAELLDKESA